MTRLNPLNQIIESGFFGSGFCEEVRQISWSVTL
jgi:hypothetical protein